jgi:hypothetical protein
MSHDDFDFEPIRGLPALLPEGERLLWQGAPDWKSLAIRAYHVRKVALYFSVLVLWRIGVGIGSAHSPSAIAVSCAFLLALGGIAIGVLSLLAYFAARATVYSITSRRVLLRHGVAVPMTINVPFKVIETAQLKLFADRTGDVAIGVTKAERIGYLITWPHLRPGFITRPQPSLRSLADASRAAEVLGLALAADAGVAALRIDATGTAPAVKGLRPRTAATA